MEKCCCPGCGAPLVTVWRKLSLKLWCSVRCRHCGERIGISWRAHLLFAVLVLMLPFGGLLTAVWLTLTLYGGNSGALGIAAFFGALVGGAVHLWAYAKFVPLMVKKSSTRE